MTSVITEFSLIEAKSKQGISYSQIQMNRVDQIPFERYIQIKKFLQLHQQQIRGQEIKAEEYEPAETEDVAE